MACRCSTSCCAAAPTARPKRNGGGASKGVIVPKAMLARVNVAKGDSLSAVEAQDGLNSGFAGKMERADDIMRRYRNTLRVLAQ